MDHKFVYFDLGQVLVHFDHQIAVQQLAEISTKSPQLVRAAVFDSELQTRFETGHVNGDQYVKEVNAALSTKLGQAEVMEAISAIFQPNDSILPVLQFVRDQGVPMGVLSNTCDAHWRWILAKQWPMLGDWFTHLVLSYEVRSMKPASRIYEVCEERAECLGPHLFFTDDRVENVAAAAARGWTTYQYGNSPGLQKSLEVWLDA